MRGSKVCELLLSKPSTASIPIIFLSDPDDRPLNCTNIIKYLHTTPDTLKLQIQINDTYKHYQNQSQLQIEKNLSRSIVNQIHSPIFITNSQTITFANQYFLDFFGLNSLNDFSLHYHGIQDLFVLSPDQKDFSLLEWIKELLTSTEEQNIVMRNKDQEQIHLKIRGELLEHSDEYLIITQDITSEVKHAKDIEELYNIDHLTKLPNRSKLIKDLETYDELALAILDIDSFKVINDFYGHVIGDFLIQKVAQRIKNYIYHENLILYRLPSDSFAIVNKQHIAKEYFEIIIISLIQIISKAPFVYPGPNEDIEIFANITGGIVFEKESAMAHADLALREAKSSHQDYIVYHDGMRQEIAYKNNLEWVQKIKIAIAQDKIIPYFQPIINNHNKKIEKYECLVRLIDEQEEVISPFLFLEIAKQSRLYESITKVMIKKSFQAFSTNNYEFSINLSIEDITDYNLFGYIKSMLSIYPLAERVCFEILETEKIENYQVIANFVSEVRELGCKVSIDDFGSGYSNFSHLLNLKFDYLKIDASLIKDIHIDKHKQIIVKTIVTFAKELGIKTIGEFVESKEIYDFITQMGIDYSQGYYFSAPVEMIT
jgi:diguanylate cyclase (GGDEF)-like protein